MRWVLPSRCIAGRRQPSRQPTVEVEDVALRDHVIVAHGGEVLDVLETIVPGLHNRVNHSLTEM